MKIEFEKSSISSITAKSFFSTSSAIIGTTIGERIVGKRNKELLLRDLTQVVSDRFSSSKEDNAEGEERFREKLLEFRLRMIGALSLYSIFSKTSYEDLVKEKSRMASFYLFWFLGATQDDIIDGRASWEKSVVSPADVRGRIFGEKRMFYRGSLNALERKIQGSSLGDHEKTYLKTKLAGWYRFLARQESGVISEPFDNFTLEYSKKYREDQNRQAGSVSVALLNWNMALDPKFSFLEDLIPGFSFLTQMIDDIGDTPEDILAKKPSYSVGALIDHQDEFNRFNLEIVKRGIKKIRPNVLKVLAPKSYQQLEELFDEYTTQLVDKTGFDGKVLTDGVRIIYKYFPYVRDFMHRINPKLVNF